MRHNGAILFPDTPATMLRTKTTNSSSIIGSSGDRQVMG